LRRRELRGSFLIRTIVRALTINRMVTRLSVDAAPVTAHVLGLASLDVAAIGKAFDDAGMAHSGGLALVARCANKPRPSSPVRRVTGTKREQTRSASVLAQGSRMRRTPPAGFLARLRAMPKFRPISRRPVRRNRRNLPVPGAEGTSRTP